MPGLPFILGASPLALISIASAAQVTSPVDPLPGISLPTPTVTPTPASTPPPTPEPASAPTPTPTPTATPARPASVRPTARATPSPVRIPAPEASPTPEPIAAAASTPAPVATATPAPIETVIMPPARQATPLWPWLAGAALLLLGAALLLLRRRRGPDDLAADAIDAPAAAAPPPVARARLAIGVRSTRAGLNLLTATVDGEVTITNTGDAPAHDIRTAVGLLSAHAGADADLADLAAQPIGRPATPPFSLAPGEERRFRAVAALPHDAIRPMTAAGRPMFVPLVAVAVRYRDEAAERQVAQGFVVGIERVDSAKLAPLWLDVPPRSFDNVAARPHAGAIER